MDIKKIMAAAKRKAAALEKALEGTGAIVTAHKDQHLYGAAVECPIITVRCDGDRCDDAYNIARAACARGKWHVASARVVPGICYLTIATAEIDDIRRAAGEIGKAVFDAGWDVAHAARLKHNGSVDAGQAAIKRLYGTADLQSVAVAYIARLDTAAALDEIAAIADAVVAEVNDLKAAYDAQESQEAVKQPTAAPETVEVAASATYTVDDGVEYMYTARVGGVEIGGASVIVYDDGDTYVERVDVDDGYRNHGYGTAMLKQLAAMYGGVYLAPDNDDARRLYARLGDDVTDKGTWGYVDQGYGVYAIAA